MIKPITNVGASPLSLLPRWGRKLTLWFVVAGVIMPSFATAQVFQSSRTGDKETWNLPIPVGAVVYKADDQEVIREVNRTISCAELYDTPHSGMYYTGGPIVQRRFEIGLATNAAGELLKDSLGNYQKGYSEWEKESGQCQQHHIERRTTPCPSHQFGERHEERRYYYQDTPTHVGIDTTIRHGDTGWVQVANTCRNL